MAIFSTSPATHPATNSPIQRSTEWPLEWSMQLQLQLQLQLKLSLAMISLKSTHWASRDKLQLQLQIELPTSTTNFSLHWAWHSSAPACLKTKLSFQESLNRKKAKLTLQLSEAVKLKEFRERKAISIEKMLQTYLDIGDHSQFLIDINMICFRGFPELY